jgi:hypothetical protein
MGHKAAVLCLKVYPNGLSLPRLQPVWQDSEWGLIGNPEGV